MGQVLISLNCVAFSFKIYFSFSFWSDFNLDSTVVKVDKIRGLKQLFTSYFLLIGKKKFSQKLIDNYRIVHEKVDPANRIELRKKLRANMRAMLLSLSRTSMLNEL